MPHHQAEKKKLDYHQINDAVVADGSDFVASFDDLADVLPNIVGYLTPKGIMRQRRVCKNCRDAARKTIVPLTEFRVESVEEYNAMNVMTRALPNLQQITLDLNRGHNWSDGDDPDEEMADYSAAWTAGWTTHDIGIISNFSKLRILNISCVLNGRYPFLFDSFPLLEKLKITSGGLKWDLEMLAGLPMLKELDCNSFSIMPCVTGSINSLRVLKDTLEKVHLRSCNHVEGNFMDLADFPHLTELDLLRTAAAGDIRDIGENDFSSLESLILPKRVYGGMGYEFQRISDAPDLIRAVYLLKKQHPALKMQYWSQFWLNGPIRLTDWYATLSEDSPDQYEIEDVDTPPFYIHFVEAGSRVGYQWETEKYIWGTGKGKPCEVNWLDPEPDRESGDYKEYIEELRKIEGRVNYYEGFHQPPTEEEYNRLLESMGMSHW